LKTFYEWDIEESTADGDIIDHNHRDRLKEYGALEVADIADGHHDLVLVRSTFEDESLRDRCWAYVVDGKLPEMFSDSRWSPTHKVPARFHKELAAFMAKAPATPEGVKA
jgi:hypothetical protein